MIDGINYYQILGLPEDALLKEIQSAWRNFVKENHEDVVPPEERQAAKERMWRINEAYGVLSNEDKRAHYDNSFMLNGGSKIELVRIRVRKAKEIIQRDQSFITGKDIKVIESIIDYLDKKTQETCFGWMIDLIGNRPEMAKHTVTLAFDEQILNANTKLFSTLLENAPQTITFEKVYLYGEDIIGISGKENKERNYNQLARVLCHRLDLAKYFVYPAFQEQASGCESGLLRTLLELAPEVMTQKDLDNYIKAVYEIRWHINSQLRSYNEQAIVWIIDARTGSDKNAGKEKTKEGATPPLTIRTVKNFSPVHALHNPAP